MLEIVKASAGSGKTFMLAGKYIQMLFKDSSYAYTNYKTILAVTFTNKATAEMKERILKELFLLSVNPDKSKYIGDLLKLPLVVKNGKGNPKEFVKNHSSNLLISILNDYSFFNVSTIDRFLQRVMRAFAREIGQFSSYNVELEHSDVLSFAVDMLMNSVDDNPVLLDRLVKLSKFQMEEGKSWDITSTLISLSQELFQEKFKILKKEIGGNLPSHQEIAGLSSALDKKIGDIRKDFIHIGKTAIDIMRQYGLEPSDYKGGSKSPADTFRKMAAGQIPSLTKSFKSLENGVDEWCSKTSKRKCDIEASVNSGLMGFVGEIISKVIDLNTAVCVKKRLNILGILGDIEAKVQEYCRNQNIVLLSETTNFLSKIIDGSDTPFLYEKVGGRIDNYLLDEFQDTSNMQWKNFLPLIKEGIDNGHNSLVVGDVKQSIYRWRGSDWSLLNQQIYLDVDQRKTSTGDLKFNWRSSRNVIDFNNGIFGKVNEKLKVRFSGSSLADVYSNYYQYIDASRTPSDGHVYVKFFKIEGRESMAANESIRKEIIGKVKQLLDGGYSQRDIAILVRSNKEGEEVSKLLIDNDYKVITEDSLLLSSAPSIRKVIATLKLLDGSGNNQLAFISEDLSADIKEKSLYNICEDIFVRIGEIAHEELPFVNAFLDYVLEFVTDSGSDLVGFLKWWDEKGANKSISAPEGDDAVRVMTIHKSKGLEFNAVILPFLHGEFAPSSKGDSYIWVKPTIPPYNRLSILPLKIEKALIDTHFAKEYNAEAELAMIDALNICYVAFTRAKEQLIVFAKESDDSFAQYLKEYVKADEYEVGDWCKPEGEPSTEQKEDGNSLQGRFVSIPIGERLSISFKGNEHFASEKDEDNRLRGIILHEIMSEIKVKEDIPGAVRKAVAAGKISQDSFWEKCEMISQKIASVAEYHWFDNSYELMTEVSIITPKGKNYRPDRVMTKGKSAVILDYKFGDTKDSDYHLQVRNYMNLLVEMGYTDIKGYLWYNDALEEVVQEL